MEALTNGLQYFVFVQPNRVSGYLWFYVRPKRALQIINLHPSSLKLNQYLTVHLVLTQPKHKAKHKNPNTTTTSLVNQSWRFSCFTTSLNSLSSRHLFLSLSSRSWRACSSGERSEVGICPNTRQAATCIVECPPWRYEALLTGGGLDVCIVESVRQTIRARWCGKMKGVWVVFVSVVHAQWTLRQRWRRFSSQQSNQSFHFSFQMAMQTFHCFMLLPTELQMNVWEHVPDTFSLFGKLSKSDDDDITTILHRAAEI